MGWFEAFTPGTLISDSVSTWDQQSSVVPGAQQAGAGTSRLHSLNLWATPALAGELAYGRENADRREDAPNGQLDVKNTTGRWPVPEAESQVCNGEVSHGQIPVNTRVASPLTSGGDQALNPTVNRSSNDSFWNITRARGWLRCRRHRQSDGTATLPGELQASFASC